MYVRKFERNRDIELSHRKTAESYYSNYTNNGNAHQVLLNQENVLRFYVERAGVKFYVQKCAEIVIIVIEISFCTKEVPVKVFADKNLEGKRYVDPFSKAF